MCNKAVCILSLLWHDYKTSLTSCVVPFRSAQTQELVLCSRPVSIEETNCNLSCCRFPPVLSHIILLNKSQRGHLFGLWTGGMLRENSEYLTRALDFHLSHQQEACTGRVQVHISAACGQSLDFNCREHQFQVAREINWHGGRDTRVLSNDYWSKNALVCENSAHCLTCSVSNSLIYS